MKIRVLAATMCVARLLWGNPIAVGELDERPLSSENVTVRFLGEYARVDGAYVFDTTDRQFGNLDMILPLVVRASDDLGALAKAFQIAASGNLIGVTQSPEFREALEREKRLARDLPSGLRLVIASWNMIGAVAASGRSEIAIAYRQPLYNGVFYYLPLTKWRTAEPDEHSVAPNPFLQLKLLAENGRDISLAEGSVGATWGNSSAMVYLKHRNLIAAKQVPAPASVERLAPWIEVVAGIRRCATHHTKLFVRAARADEAWRNIASTNIEVFEDCPNAFLWATTREGDPREAKSVTVHFESCSKCENDYEKFSAQAKINREKKPPTIEQAYLASSVVFYGHVIGTRVVRKEVNGIPKTMLTGTFEVLRKYKGEPEKQVEVETPIKTMDGQYGFGPGSYHLVYATGTGPFYMDRFGRSMPAWAADMAFEGKVEFREVEKLAAAQAAKK